MARGTPDAPASLLQASVVASTRPRRRLRLGPLGWLALPLLVYVIPLVLGFGWSSISPNTPNIPGLAYSGRTPNTPTTIEWFGTGVVVIPLQARIREYVAAGELPLWNPYQGLGQPFAAQGEGSPYYPLAILRALPPYYLGNWITVAAIYIAGVSLYGFLRHLGGSQVSATFAGIAYELSGAFSLYLARPSIADQLGMLAVLFWATLWALRRRTLGAYVLLAVAAAFHAIAGHIQIALLDAMLLMAFIVIYVAVLNHGRLARLRNAGVALGAFALGNGLAAFYLLPVAEAIHVSLNVRSEGVGFQVVPFANGVAFVAPSTFGPLFGNWIPGARYGAVDWNNLYAYASVTVTALVVLGWTVGWHAVSRRTALGFQFFSLAGVFLLLRFLGFPLIEAVNVLPVLGRQTPKHANAVTVFCLAIAAGLAVDRLRARPEIRVRWRLALIFCMLASAVLTLIGLADGFSGVDGKLAATYVPTTLVIVSTVLGVIWLARRWSRLGPMSAGLLVTGVAVAELSVYVPLGNNSVEVLAGRVLLMLLIAGVGLLAVLGRTILATAMALLATVTYAAIVILPSDGLPRQFDVDNPTASMNWLKMRAGDAYRSFGVAPDFSSVVALQDVGTVGPLAPTDFANFVDLLGDPVASEYYRRVGHLWVSVSIIERDHYDLRAYPRAKPALDWAGVRYVNLDRNLINPGTRTDDQALYGPGSGLSVVYADGTTRILESAAARSKAEFWTGADVYPDRTSLLRDLQADPSSILGPPKLEAVEVPASVLPSGSAAQSSTVSITTYSPNDVVLEGDAPTAGLVELKDSYFPGWSVTVNGQPQRVIHVNGIVRGVIVPRAGHYEVHFEYRPMSFVSGVILGIGIAVLFATSMVYVRLRTTRALPAWTVAVGGLLVGMFVVLLVQAYWGSISGP